MKRAVPTRSPSIDFDLRQLEVFCKVVELGSFSKAAEEVFLAQASVSERVANLERMLGTRLLDRLGRQVVPTRAGERLYQRALPLLSMKRAICLDMEGFLGVQRGEVHVGGSTIPGEYLLPEVLGRFRKTYPGISVRVEIADTGRIAERVLEGALELGVVGSRVPDSRLVQQGLWEDELVLAVPPHQGWGNRREVSLKDLYDAEAWILREDGSGTQKSLDNFLRDAGGRGIDSLRVAARLGSSTAVKQGVKAGLGIAILSYHALEIELETGDLKALRVTDIPMKRCFHLIHDRRRTASPLCRAITDFLLTTADCPPAQAPEGDISHAKETS